MITKWEGKDKKNRGRSLRASDAGYWILDPGCRKNRKEEDRTQESVDSRMAKAEDTLLR